MVSNSNDNTNFPHELLLKLIDKLQIFIKFLLKIHQLILNYQKLNYQK